MTQKKTVGQVSQELSSKTPDTRSPIEQMREQLEDYDKNVWECVDRSKKDFDADFYVVVITKKERLLENVLRNYFMGRISCPTPDYDQTVYYYNRNSESLSFLWTIPSKDTCLIFLENKEFIAPNEYGLLEFVLKFNDGTLFKEAKRRNREQKDSPLIDASSSKRAIYKS